MNDPEHLFTDEEIRANRRQLLLMLLPMFLAALVAAVAVVRAVL